MIKVLQTKTKKEYLAKPIKHYQYYRGKRYAYYRNYRYRRYLLVECPHGIRWVRHEGRKEDARKCKWCSQPPNYGNPFYQLIFQPFYCKRCGQYFEARSHKALYCKDCRKLDNTHYRRCLKYGCPYDWRVKAVEVFEEENYICYLCKEPTLPEMRGLLHPRAPELEHIIPLSSPNSPGHVRSNVACSCHKCNYTKHLEES